MKDNLLIKLIAKNEVSRVCLDIAKIKLKEINDTATLRMYIDMIDNALEICDKLNIGSCYTNKLDMERKFVLRRIQEIALKENGVCINKKTGDDLF